MTAKARERTATHLSISIAQVVVRIRKIRLQLYSMLVQPDRCLHVPFIIIATGQVAMSNGKVWTQADRLLVGSLGFRKLAHLL